MGGGGREVRERVGGGGKRGAGGKGVSGGRGQDRENGGTGTV